MDILDPANIGVHEDLSDLLTWHKPIDLSLLNLCMNKQEAMHDTEIKWIEESLNPVEDAVDDGSGWNDTDTTGLPVDNVDRFEVDQIWLIEDEQVRITAVGATLSAERGFGTTTAAAHADDTPLYLLGTARKRGNDGQDMLAPDQVTRNNYAQLFARNIKMTRTNAFVKNVGGNNFDVKSAQKLQEIFREINSTLWDGTKLNDTSNLRGGSQGLLSVIAELAPSGNIVDHSGANISETILDSTLKTCKRNGQKADVCLMSDTQFEKVSKLLTAHLTSRADDTVFGGQVLEYVSPHGRVTLLPDEHLSRVHSDKFIAGSSEYAKLRKLRFEQWQNGPVGSSIDVQMEFECSGEFHHAEVWAIAENLAT